MHSYDFQTISDTKKAFPGNSWLTGYCQQRLTLAEEKISVWFRGQAWKA